MKRLFVLATLVLLAEIITFQISTDSAVSRTTRPQPTPTPRPTPRPSPTPTPTSVPGPTTTELKLKISGVVNRCTPGDIEGSEVYLEGESFFLKTGTSGDFKFFGVPVGTHQLVFDLPNLAPYKTSVNVGTQATNMGFVNVCPDGDNDGFNAQDDCDDSNNTVYPGAPEVCNVMDDDCDDERDEGLIPNTQDVSIEIVNPADGANVSPIRSFEIWTGGACDLESLGVPNDFLITAIFQAPDGFPIKAALILTKPSGNKVFLTGENPDNHNELANCTPECGPEPVCCRHASTTSDFLDEFGTYTVTAIVVGNDNSILAQDSIIVNIPEPLSE